MCTTSLLLQIFFSQPAAPVYTPPPPSVAYCHYSHCQSWLGWAQNASTAYATCQLPVQCCLAGVLGVQTGDPVQLFFNKVQDEGQLRTSRSEDLSPHLHRHLHAVPEEARYAAISNGGRKQNKILH